uniref:Uncharacterized protein n=1 Tax=Plectus sambesii TaxID=2011161 RepID=A0A914XCJ7_9BILA
MNGCILSFCVAICVCSLYVDQAQARYGVYQRTLLDFFEKNRHNLGQLYKRADDSASPSYQQVLRKFLVFRNSHFKGKRMFDNIRVTPLENDYSGEEDDDDDNGFYLKLVNSVPLPL